MSAEEPKATDALTAAVSAEQQPPAAEPTAASTEAAPAAPPAAVAEAAPAPAPEAGPATTTAAAPEAAPDAAAATTTAAAPAAAPAAKPGVVVAPAGMSPPTSPGTSDGDDNRPELTEAEEAVVARLRDLQKLHEGFEMEYLEEWNQLKLKYLKKFKPLYASRATILCEPPATVTEGKPAPVGTTSLPGFWLRALKNQRTLADIITDRDEPVLNYLTDIRSDWLNEEEQLSFMLTFTFAPNPYFEHQELTKSYNMNRDDDGEGVLMNTKGTDIKWLPNKDVTKVVVTKKQRNPRTKATRVVKDVKTVPSFFDFFNSLEFPSPEQFEAMDPEEAKEMEDEVEAEFDVGCIIREKIIPHALGWFMGEERDELSDESDFSEDDDEDDGDSDEDED